MYADKLQRRGRQQAHIHDLGGAYIVGSCEKSTTPGDRQRCSLTLIVSGLPVISHTKA